MYVQVLALGKRRFGLEHGACSACCLTDPWPSEWSGLRNHMRPLAVRLAGISYIHHFFSLPTSTLT